MITEPPQPSSAPAEAGVPGPEDTRAPLIALGASAGGLDALERFFDHCPRVSGCAFVVIQHLSPAHKSMMSELLARHTRMTVKVAEEGMPVLPDQVYLIPPGTLMRVVDGCLRLSPKAPHVLSLPIDVFFVSMAREYGARCAAIVVSGTGSDGTRGAAEVNAADGLVLVQEPGSAKFDGMPRSLIATGVVDAVLPAERLAASAIDYLRHGTEVRLEDADWSSDADGSTEADPFTGILNQLRVNGDIDFLDYKPATMRRRLQRRMQLRKVGSLADYLSLIDGDVVEATALRKEMLIGVTAFFRDSEAFESLAREAVAPLLASKGPGEPVRIWVAGISTGEEPYSIAMLFLEACERQQRWSSFKVFATDVDAQAIEIASQGRYPESILNELGPTRLERFFVSDSGGYQVRPELRQHIVFARHNLLSDPPFTRIDLVVCRNTLIYFKQEAQERVFARFQYALNPGGYLFLGSSEALGNAQSGFSTVDSRHKLFRRFSTGTRPLLDTLGASAAPWTRRRAPRSAVAGPVNDGSLIDHAGALLQDSYLPPSLLVNPRQEVVHIFGDARRFLSMGPGSASLQVHRMLPEAIGSLAMALITRVLREGEVARTVTDLHGKDGTAPARVQLICRPVAIDQQPRHALLTLIAASPEEPAAAAAEAWPGGSAAEDLDRIGMLERELQAIRENLQATIEELETSNEELQATNEELISANEELQSSNEELQSLNEELNTVNAEFQEQVELLNRTHADLEGMARAVRIPTVFVDSGGILTRFSPDAAHIFKLRSGDLGRPLDDIAHVLEYPDLMHDLHATLATGEARECEVHTRDRRRTYLVRLLPYAITAAAQGGVVATFIDISDLQYARRLQAIIDGLPEHIAVLEPDGRIALVNQAWRRFAAANGDPELRHSGPGANYLQACADATADEISANRAARGIREVLEGVRPHFSLQYPCHAPDEHRWFVMNAAPIEGHGFGAVVSHINISAWLKASPHEDSDVVIETP